MHYEFTSAALRALDAATRLAPPDAEGRWRSPELLLALAAEEESRAGTLLAARQVSVNLICRHWPELAVPFLSHRSGDEPLEPAPPTVISRNLRMLLRSIHSRLGHLEPFVVATDHLLWGLLNEEGDVAEWLTGQGFEPAEFEVQLLRAYGQVDSPPCGTDQDEGLSTTGMLEMPDDEPPPRLLVQVGTHDRMTSIIEEHGSLSRSLEDVATLRRPLAVELPAALPQIAQPPVLQPAASSGELAILRVLDAAANRAREGLRVIEDYTRFVLDDRHLTGLLKGLRHELAAALQAVPLGELLAARDTLRDVGVELSTAGEERRRGPAEIATANFKRVQEALRTLEEFGKLRDTALATSVKQLRYRTYTLERAVRTTARRGALADARLYVLLDGRANEREFRELAEQLVAAGTDVLQLRDKRLNDRQLLSRAGLLREITATSRTLLIVNDRPDLAALAGADGVHVGQEELSVHAARSIVGPGCLVGVSTHSLAQARQAVLDGADYIGIGPTFPSGTKAFDDFVGIEVVAAVCDEIRLPAFAIGGIDEQNIPLLLDVGCRRIAVSAAVCNADEPAAAARRLRERLRG
ncbi:MAG: thiamine phosphate synthase [Pirellulales bacterium]